MTPEKVAVGGTVSANEYAFQADREMRRTMSRFRLFVLGKRLIGSGDVPFAPGAARTPLQASERAAPWGCVAGAAWSALLLPVVRGARGPTPFTLFFAS